MRTTHPLCWIVILLLAAAPAAAVVVDLEAVDSGGAPLPGATLRIGGEETTTDEDGRARVEIDRDPGAEVAVEVIYRDETVYQGVVEVGAGPATLRTSAPPRMSTLDDPVFSDGFESGDSSFWADDSPWRKPVVRVTLGSERIDPELDNQTFEVVTRVNGSVIPEQSSSGTLGPGELEEIRRGESKRSEVTGNYGLRLDYPLPGFGGGRRPARLIEVATPADSARTTSAGPAANRAPRGWRFYPTLSLGISQADVEFQSIELASGRRTTFAGDGLVYGAGIRGVLFPCAGCRWFATLGYEHSRTEDLEMVRTPQLQAFVPDGIVAAGDRVEYRFASDSAQLTLGRSYRHIAPWAGLRATRFRADLDIDLLLQVPGAQAEQSQSARNEFEEDLLEAVVGADVRFPGRRLALRFEGSTDGDNYRLAAGFGATLRR